MTQVVNKGTANIIWATPQPVNQGWMLSSAQLNASSNLPGTYVYSPAAGTVLSTAGAQTLTLTFTPTDTTNYTSSTTTVSLQVNTATQACAALNGMAIPANAIGLATTGGQITATSIVTAASAKAGVEYCKVVGVIHPVNASETVISVGNGVSTTVPTQDITFNVMLPTSWNSKMVQLGGGGFDGSVPNLDTANTSLPGGGSIASPLNRGYAVYGSDSGHTSAAMPQTLWNQEALRNFGREAVKKAHDAVQYVVIARYGNKASYSYFFGGSQGGHEALIAANFYPYDYDGVIVGYPAYNLEAMHPGSIDYGKALYQLHTAATGYTYPSVTAGDGWISRPQMAAVAAAIINGMPSISWGGCDALDGAVDGLVSNPGDPACVAFKKKLYLHTGDVNNPAVGNPMRCVGGVHSYPITDTTNWPAELCLSDIQIETLVRLTSRYPLYKTVASQNTPTSIEGGITSYAKWPMLDGIWFAKDINKDNSQEDFGSAYNVIDAFQASFPTTDQVQMLTQMTWTAAQVGSSFDINDPKWYPDRILTVSSYLDTNSVDYETFRGRGGKIIHYAGHSDVSIASFNSVDLFLRMSGQFFTAKNSSGDLYIGDSPFWGASFDATWNASVPQRSNVTVSGGIVDDFYTFYHIPGFGHGHGYYAAAVDWLTALENWRERDVAPRNSLISTDTSTLNTSVTPNTGHVSLGTRPVCYFPYYPKFTANVSSDITLAANYTCTKQDAFINLK